MFALKRWGHHSATSASALVIKSSLSSCTPPTPSKIHPLLRSVETPHPTHTRPRALHVHAQIHPESNLHSTTQPPFFLYPSTCSFTPPTANYPSLWPPLIHPPSTHYQPCQSKLGCLKRIPPSTTTSPPPPSFISLPLTALPLSHTRTHTHAGQSHCVHHRSRSPRSIFQGWEGLPADSGPLCAAQLGAWLQSQNMTKPRY